MVEVETKIQRYDSYKDSGVEWLGEIPEHWHATKVKNVFRLVTEPAHSNNDFELLSVYTDIGVKPRKDLEERGNKASTTDGYWLVKRGDVVVNKLLAWMGAIGVSDYDGVTSPAYDILRAKVKIESNFYHYLFRNSACISELKKHSRGIMDMRLRLYFDKFGDVIIPYPNYNEQKLIVDFLDDKTTKIDEAIAIKQQQIALLKERKQILIHKAVTKGVTSSAVDMKDSGVQWIGEIPEHWEVKKVTHLFNKIGSGTTPTSGDNRYYDGKYNFLQTGDLNDSTVFKTKRTLKERAFRDFSSLKIYPKGSLVMAMYGATIGKLGILGVKSATNQACCIFGKPNNLIIEYFFQVLLAFRTEIISLGYGGGQPNISQDLIKSLRFPIAPLSEQKEIAQYIETASTKIETAINLKEQEISKLQEYKNSLINSVVTGKVRVC